jgi:hypothetical protein
LVQRALLPVAAANSKQLQDDRSDSDEVQQVLHRPLEEPLWSDYNGVKNDCKANYKRGRRDLIFRNAAAKHAAIHTPS